MYNAMELPMAASLNSRDKSTGHRVVNLQGFCGEKLFEKGKQKNQGFCVSLHSLIFAIGVALVIFIIFSPILLG